MNRRWRQNFILPALVVLVSLLSGCFGNIPARDPTALVNQTINRLEAMFRNGDVTNIDKIFAAVVEMPEGTFSRSGLKLWFIGVFSLIDYTEYVIGQRAFQFDQAKESVVVTARLRSEERPLGSSIGIVRDRTITLGLEKTEAGWRINAIFS